MGLPVSSIAGVPVVPFLLRDDYLDDRAAGSVNSTLATPGGIGTAAMLTRNVTDTGNVLSISSSQAVWATNAAGTYGDPDLVYGSHVREFGRTFLCRFSKGNTVNNFAFGWGDNALVFDNSAPGVTFGIGFVIGTIYINDDVNIASTVTAVGSYLASTVYHIAVTQRAAGGYFFWKDPGGAWKLLWVSSLDASTPVYPGMTIYRQAMTVDFARIPFALFVVPQLLNDTFTRINGNLTASETTGADGQAVLSRTYVGSNTFQISGNQVVNTPATFGAELLTDGDMELAGVANWPDYSTPPTTKAKLGGAARSGVQGLQIISNLANEGAQQQVVSSVGTWLKVVGWGNGVGTGTGRISVTNLSCTGDAVIANGVWTQSEHAGYVRVANPTIQLWITTAARQVYYDDCSIKALTLTELIQSVNCGVPDVIADVSVTMANNCDTGLILKLDSQASPANFILALLTNGGNTCTLHKCVAGTYTQLISTAVTYSAGAILRVILDGSAVRLYYNGVQVGTTQTVSDGGIINNVLHGIFSTDAGNVLDNLRLWSRGNDGSYSQLDSYISGDS